MPAQTVPSWPIVSAVVRADASAEVTINGTSHQVPAAGSLDDTRSVVLALIADHTAAEVGRPVRVTTSDPDGSTWALLVHPDGRAEPDPAIPAWPARNGTTPTPASNQQHEIGWPNRARRRHQPATDSATAGQSQPNGHPDRPHAHPADLTPPPPAPAPDPPPPTLHDLISAGAPPAVGLAELGWRARVRRATGGAISPRPSAVELAHRQAVAAVQRSLSGPKTIVVMNPKGGAGKTTAALLLAAAFGGHRGGYTLAWNNNETRGTLGWRAQSARHTNTAVDLLADLDRFADPTAARVGDLDNYVRGQGSAQFDVLASDEGATSAASIDADAFGRLHSTLARFYRVLIVDTGNNMRASNFAAAVDAADLLVIVSTVRVDTAQSAAWLIDALRAAGHGHAVETAVTVLATPARAANRKLTARLHDHFGALTRTVLDVPYDPALVGGGPIPYHQLAAGTHQAWLQVAATIADGL